MHISQTPTFQKAVKRLHANQKGDLDKAVKAILDDPDAGEAKKGDLAGMRVYKFRMVNQLTLLAYEVIDGKMLVLHALGGHENFYRDLKAN